ncbi:MAG: hypothetical protein ACLFRV_10465 [Acidimicrobiales bacterium]
MDGHCDKHVFEATEATCRHCGGDFCGDCLVYAHGPKKPPLCVSCALAAAGIRSTAARPVVRSKREIKREEKTRKRARKLAAKASTSVSTDALFDAKPLSDSPAGGAPGPRGVEFEFTINDDGTVDRPEERQAS